MTKEDALARAKALASFSVNVVHHIAAGDMVALRQALTRLERTVADLRDYQVADEPPMHFNMFSTREGQK